MYDQREVAGKRIDIVTVSVLLFSQSDLYSAGHAAPDNDTDEQSHFTHTRTPNSLPFA